MPQQAADQRKQLQFKSKRVCWQFPLSQGANQFLFKALAQLAEEPTCQCESNLLSITDLNATLIKGRQWQP